MGRGGNGPERRGRARAAEAGPGEKVAKTYLGRGVGQGGESDRLAEALMPPRGFAVPPRRWAVERTFSWSGQNRRMSKDDERLCASAEAFVYAAMTRLMVSGRPVRRSSKTVFSTRLGE